MHNFATLISKYNGEIDFLSGRSIGYAEKLLLSAQKNHGSFITLKELGDLYINKRAYKRAVKFYREALNYDVRYDVVYNISVCYYQLKDYENMRNILERALQSAELSDTEKCELMELLCVSLNLCGEKDLAKSIFKDLTENGSYSINPMTIKLAYLCDNFSFVVNNYNNVFSEWLLLADEYEIIYESFLKVDSKITSELKDWINENIIKFYKDNPDFVQDTELLHTVQSKHTVPKVIFNFCPVFSCDFY